MNNFTNETQSPLSSLAEERFRSDVSFGMGIIGVISTISSFTIISMILYLRLYQKMHTRFIIYLCTGDFIQGLAASSSLGWIKWVPIIGESLCTYQSVMFEIGDLASALASFFIGLFVWLNMHYLQYSWVKIPGKKYEILVVVMVFVFPVVLCIIGQIKAAVTKIPIYTPVGFSSWCWISELYPIERLMLHYTWIILICLILFGLYIHMVITLSQSTVPITEGSEDHEKRKRKRLAKKMIGFPIIYFFAFIPLGIERVTSTISNGNVQLPNAYVAFAITIFVLNGFMNSTLYGYTRKLFQKIVQSFDEDRTNGKEKKSKPLSSES